MKRIFALMLVVLLCATMLAGCFASKEETLSPQQAIQIAAEDLGVIVDKVPTAQVTEGIYEGAACYYVEIAMPKSGDSVLGDLIGSYLTHKYVIGNPSGEILSKN